LSEHAPRNSEGERSWTLSGELLRDPTRRGPEPELLQRAAQLPPPLGEEQLDQPDLVQSKEGALGLMTTTADETFGGGSKDSLGTSSSGLTSDESCEITDIALIPVCSRSGPAACRRSPSGAGPPRACHSGGRSTTRRSWRIPSRGGWRPGCRTPWNPRTRPPGAARGCRGPAPSSRGSWPSSSSNASKRFRQPCSARG
jgi:hypothetical protein